MLFKDIYKLTQPGSDWGPVLDKPTSPPQTLNTESNVVNNDSIQIADRIGEANVNINLAFEMCERI